MPDFKWMSLGGVLLDGNGDIAMATPQESVVDMVRTRLKADLNGWKLYQIGADLKQQLGDAVTAELEISIRRRVQSALTNQFLAPNQFTVTTRAVGGLIDIYVHVLDELVATVQVNRETGLSRIV
jgi:hypothetical protein